MCSNIMETQAQQGAPRRRRQRRRQKCSQSTRSRTAPTAGYPVPVRDLRYRMPCQRSRGGVHISACLRRSPAEDDHKPAHRSPCRLTPGDVGSPIWCNALRIIQGSGAGIQCGSAPEASWWAAALARLVKPAAQVPHTNAGVGRGGRGVTGSSNACADAVHRMSKSMRLHDALRFCDRCDVC